MNDIKSIIHRMKKAFRVNTNKELAEKLGTSLSNIDNWKKRNSIPQKYILLTSQMNDINPDWLLTGEGEMYKGSTPQDPFCTEICDNFKKLPKEKQKYLYHTFMSKIYKNLKDV